MVSVMGKRGLFLVWLCLVSILPGMAQTEKLIDYVNPFVGTDGYGNVYPGAQIPFGGIQMSPDTDSKYYDAASGYKYNHSSFCGYHSQHSLILHQPRLLLYKTLWHWSCKNGFAQPDRQKNLPLLQTEAIQTT